MSTYQRVNWDDLTDAHVPNPPGYVHPWETYVPYASRVVSGPIGCEHLAISVNRMPPGTSGEHHSHPEAEEIYVVMDGSCQMMIGEDVVELKRFDAVRLPAMVMHSLYNHTDAECWLIVMAAPIDEFVAVSDEYLPGGGKA